MPSKSIARGLVEVFSSVRKKEARRGGPGLEGPTHGGWVGEWVKFSHNAEIKEPEKLTSHPALLVPILRAVQRHVKQIPVLSRNVIDSQNSRKRIK